MLTPTTNSSQIRRFRSSNFGCQSPLPASFRSSERGWPTVAGRRRRVSPTRRARPGTLASCSARRGAPDAFPTSPIHSIPSSLSLLAEKTEPPLPPPLRRARTRSPPRHRASKPATSSALSPSTPSSHPYPQTHHGKAALPIPPPQDLVGVRPRDGSPWPRPLGHSLRVFDDASGPGSHGGAHQGFRVGY
jgi:hypothetical protein